MPEGVRDHWGYAYGLHVSALAGCVEINVKITV